jgi:GT2 family glycosyltransferase
METDAPLITTIIPTYRRPELLRRAIRSALSQTYPHFQVCVYDNASGDETAAVVAQLARDDPRVKYHCHPENIGMSANFTYGMERIDTPYFSILSDDDVLLPEFYATTMRGFADHPDIVLSAGSIIVMTERGRVLHVPLSSWARGGYFAPPEGLWEWTMDRHPYITGILFRTEVIGKVGMLNPTLLNADFEYEWRLVSRYPYVVSREPCAIIALHQRQATKTSGAEAWRQGYEAMREQVVANEALPQESKQRALQSLTDDFARKTFALGLDALRANDVGIARISVAALNDTYQARKLARMLEIATDACAFNPLFSAPIRWRRSIMLSLIGAKNRRYEKRYARYLHSP